MEHTATPWLWNTVNHGQPKVFAKKNGFYALMDGTGDYEELRANAKFICQAVNSHEELLEACHNAAEFYHERAGQDEVCTEEILCLWCKAIAKAEGK